MLLYATAGTHGDAERISIQRVFDVDVFLFFSPGICPFRVHGMHVILPSSNACKWRLHMLVQNRLFYFAMPVRLSEQGMDTSVKAIQPKACTDSE